MSLLQLFINAIKGEPPPPPTEIRGTVGIHDQLLATVALTDRPRGTVAVADQLLATVTLSDGPVNPG